MKNDILTTDRQGMKGADFTRYFAGSMRNIQAQNWQSFTILLTEYMQDWKHTGSKHGTDKTTRTTIDISGNIKEQINDYILAIEKRRSRKFINVDVKYKFISASYTDQNGIEHNYM